MLCFQSFVDMVQFFSTHSVHRIYCMCCRPAMTRLWWKLRLVLAVCLTGTLCSTIPASAAVIIKCCDKSPKNINTERSLQSKASESSSDCDTPSVSYTMCVRARCTCSLIVRRRGSALISINEEPTSGSVSTGMGDCV